MFFKVAVLGDLDRLLFSLFSKLNRVELPSVFLRLKSLFLAWLVNFWILDDFGIKSEDMLNSTTCSENRIWLELLRVVMCDAETVCGKLLVDLKFLISLLSRLLLGFSIFRIIFCSYKKGWKIKLKILCNFWQIPNEIILFRSIYPLLSYFHPR